MPFTNSGLASVIVQAKYYVSPRNHAIDTISIHCMAGQMSAQACGDYFATIDRTASSNYGIGPDGTIGLYVSESDRSYCTSSSDNDNRAVTIEVASEPRDPYKVTDAAFSSLITLVTDICYRNGIKKLMWRGDPSLIGQVDKQNMTVHRWFSSKACPGDYLYNKHPEIVQAVNTSLGTWNPNDVKPLSGGLITTGLQTGTTLDYTYAPIGGSAAIGTTVRSSSTNDQILTIKQIDETPLVDGNSSLASYKNRVCPNDKSLLRTTPINCITVHISKSKGTSLKQLSEMMNSSGTTYNYGIDNEGQIGLFLDEPYPSNATGEPMNDDRSVNIVCVNKTLDPDYEISKRCFDSLVDLCEDICRRNFISVLKYDKDWPFQTTLTIHSQFSKGCKCPGPYVKSKLEELQKEVNVRLGTENRKRVSVTSWQADSELAALRAQSTVSLGAIKPYIARIADDNLEVSYIALQNMGVVGVMFNGGFLYKDNKVGHEEKKKFSNKNLYDQIDDFKVQGTGMPFGIYYTTRATNVTEAKAECEAFYYIVSKYRPKLGAWVRCDLSVKKAMALTIVDFYYEKFIRWGFKSKCGIIASQKQAELIGWPKQASYMPLWLEESMDPTIAPKDEILTPSYFKLGNLSNWGYNEEEDRERVEDYVEQLRQDLAIHQAYGSDTGIELTDSTALDVENHGDYSIVRVPPEPNYKGAKTVEHRTAVSSGGQKLMRDHPHRTADPQGFSMWDGRYGVAVGSSVCGTVGTYINVILENGVNIPCIMFDQKADIHTDPTYHMFSMRNGAAAWCCSEFTIENSYSGTGNASSSHPGWDSKVKEFWVYTGNYLRDTGF